jgi:hypothetical protein
MNRSVFITNMDSVYCTVQTHSLNKRDYLSSFKGLIASYCYCIPAAMDGIRSHCEHTQNTLLVFVLHYTTESDLGIGPDSWIIHD